MGKKKSLLILMMISFVCGVLITRDYLKPKTEDNNAQKVLGTTASTSTITNLYFHHWASGSPWVVRDLPTYYYGFTNATYNADEFIPGKTQPLLAQYVECNMAMPEGTYPNEVYPILYDDIKDKELLFTHSTNPAELTIIKGSSKLNLYWKYDERYDNYQGLSYNLYRVDNASIDGHKLWDQVWRTLNWQKIASVNASAFDSGTADAGKFLNYTDTGYNSSGVSCYLIRTVNNGEETEYSTPVCKDYSQSTIPTIYLTHSDIQLVSKVKYDDLYSNNTYQISLRGVGFSSPKVALWGNDGGWKYDDNQFAYNFHEVQSYSMTQSGNKASLTLTLKRPYLLKKGGSTTGWTEDPTFKFAASGINFPQDGGYLVMGPNNKLQNRFWKGYGANPASADWKNKVLSVIQHMQLAGYNAVFFDNWGMRLYDIDSNGTAKDAPAIEFYYPETEPSGFQDPSTLALNSLATYLKSNISSMFLLGNSLNNNNESLTVINKLDGAMFEACIHNGAVKVTGSDLAKTFSILEGALNQGKKIVCLPAFYDGGSGGVSPLDPGERLYTLAAFMMVAQAKSTGNAMYGRNELQPRWGENVNYFGENLVDLGDPTSSRNEIASNIWKRTFSNGSVFVNASGSDKTLGMSNKLYKVAINGVVVNRNTSGGIVSGDQGYVSYQEIPAGSAVPLKAGEGIIFVNSLPSSNGTGLKGEYFDNKDLTNLVKTKVDTSINFDWGTGSPDAAVGADTFSVRWSGQIEPRFSQTYTFYTQSDDGVRLWVNDEKIIDNWTSHASVENSGTISLEAGQKYNIVLEYFDDTVNAIIKLSWSSPSQPKEIVPKLQLFPDIQNTPTPTAIPTPTPNPGDINNDTTVNSIDYQILSYSYGKSDGQVGYDDRADLKDDGVINSLDYQILSNNYGLSY